MILNEMSIDNVGVFAGLQDINLTPRKLNQPIVLINGSNGSGKSTLMNALRIGLYGSNAFRSIQNGSSYSKLLDQKIRRDSTSKESSVSIDFDCKTSDRSSNIRVTRIWRRTKSGIREDLNVIVDQRTDEFLKENWSQYVNEIIPSNLSPLFFIDGERITELATTNSFNGLIQMGIYSLFGIDTIDRLQKDLRVVERRRLASSIPDIDKEVINKKESELRSIGTKIIEAEKERSNLQNFKLIDAKNNLAIVMNEYRQLGGEILDRREKLQVRIGKLESSLDDYTERMVELASSELPLLIISDLLQEALEVGYKEKIIHQARSVVEHLEERDTEMFTFLRAQSISKELIEALEHHCSEDLEERQNLASEKTHVHMNDDVIYQLKSIIQDLLPGLAGSTKDILANQKQLEESLDATRLEFMKIPSKDSIEEIIIKRDVVVAEISRIETSISSLDHTLEALRRSSEQLESEINTLWENIAESESLRLDTARFIRHTQMAKQKLSEFSSALISRQISRVESSALESLQNLLRKDRLIADLHINPHDFSIKFSDENRQSLQPEHLSAGERQLLVIALIWGMARSSGRILPVLIDSPMGRLDTAHRNKLVERFFPCASHQTLIFSTDEEITGNYFDRLEPWIGRCYDLVYSEATKSSTVLERVG